MLPDGPARELGAPILDRLRSATRTAHEALETGLALLEPPLRRDRFIRVLGGFRAFHKDWEPRMEPLIGDPDLTAPRRKLALLERDLDALGEMTPASNRQPFDLDFLTTPSAAWGSLYVLEGSALGGQVIHRALRTADWAPEAGLAYFNPYETHTGLMWRQFRAALEARGPSLDPDAVAAGACATFATLQAGLAQAKDLVA